VVDGHPYEIKFKIPSPTQGGGASCKLPCASAVKGQDLIVATGLTDISADSTIKIYIIGNPSTHLWSVKIVKTTKADEDHELEKFPPDHG
jgi:hypothetical protein